MLLDVSSSLAHPLLLLVVGAAISSFLVPALTRRWQDHQKELEVKVGLVEQMSKAVAEFVIAIQFAELGAESQTQEQLDNAYRSWEIGQPTIGARLRAYFPHSLLAEEWRVLGERVTELYATTGVHQPADRERRLRSLLTAAADDVRSPTELWGDAKLALLAEQEALSRKVLETPIAVFDRPLWRRGTA